MVLKSGLPQNASLLGLPLPLFKDNVSDIGFLDEF